MSKRLIGVLTTAALLPLTSFGAATPLAAAAQCTPESLSGGFGYGGQTRQTYNALGGSSFGGSSFGGKRPSNPDPAPRGPKTNKDQLVLDGPTQIMHMLTGPGSIDRTDTRWNVTSTDLGISYLDESRNQTFVALGDTFHCHRPGDDGWRSNVLLRSTDSNYGDGFNLESALTAGGFNPSGEAKQFIPARHDLSGNTEVTTIPTAAVEIDGVHYMDYMSVRKWGEAGAWSTNYAATVRSSDGGKTWTLVPDSIRRMDSYGHLPVPASQAPFKPGYEKLQMAAFIEQGDYVYRYSTPSGRFSSAVVSRAPKAQFPKESSFEYYTGSGWSKDPSSAATALDGHVAELSIAYSSYLKRYVAVYLVEGVGLVMRTAESPTGPWSQRRVLVDKETMPSIYGGFIMPKQDDQHLYFVASTWNDYNSYLMRTDLDYTGPNMDVDDNTTVRDVVNY